MTPSGTSTTSLRQSRPETRRLVIDEDISRKLSFELQRRGRGNAIAVLDARLNGRKDGALFKALIDFEPCVLVTYDNRMPFVHSRELEHHGTTVAVVSRRAFRRSWHTVEDSYIRDVVHRWAHVIEMQTAGTVRSYGDKSVTRARTPRTYADTTRP